MLKLIRKSLQIVQKDKPDQPIEKFEQTSTKVDPDKAAIIVQSWYRAQIQRARKAQLKRANSEKLHLLSPFPATSAATSRNHSSLHIPPRGGSPSIGHAPLDIFNVHAPPRHDHLFDHMHNAPSSGFESYHSRSSSISTESYHSRTASGGASSDRSGGRALLGQTDASEDIRARCRKKLDWSSLMTELLHEAESRSHGSDEEQQPLSGVEPQQHVPNMGIWEQQNAAPSPSRRPSLLSKTYGMDDFEILSMLGDGDSGKVCLARLRGTDRTYAMKIISKQRVLQEKKIHRVMTERNMLARADHPFVVKLYLAFQTLTDLCFVMEYCPGGELFKVMQSQPNKCLSEHDAQFYAAEVLLALEYVHMLGFIYRDLKPENILLEKDGHVKLIDFDLAKRAVSDYQAHFIRPRKYGQKASRALGLVDIQPRDRFTSRVGTCGYAAPEVLNGDGHTSSADWWTFGVLLYEMLFGRLPFNGTQLQQLQQMRGDSLDIPESPAVSQHCKHLIKKLLTFNPKKRLGRKHGASEIKQHLFFSTINWPLIRKNPGPIVPAKTIIPPSTRRPQGRTSPGHSKLPAYPTHLPTSPSKTSNHLSVPTNSQPYPRHRTCSLFIDTNYETSFYPGPSSALGLSRIPSACPSGSSTPLSSSSAQPDPSRSKSTPSDDVDPGCGCSCHVPAHCSSPRLPPQHVQDSDSDSDHRRHRHRAATSAGWSLSLAGHSHKAPTLSPTKPGRTHRTRTVDLTTPAVLCPLCPCLHRCTKFLPDLVMANPFVGFDLLRPGFEAS